MVNKLLVYMIDGVAAEHYERDRLRFPHFYSLELRGFRIKNLQSVALGTSLPGRTGMLTGVTADVSGVYGNKVWGGDDFRYANPADIQVQTIPQRAQQANLTVASIGAGMIRYEDTDIMRPPWWIDGEMLKRARDEEAQQGGISWDNVYRAPITDAFKSACEKINMTPTYAELPDDTHPYMRGLLHDQRITDWMSALAIADDSPDLIWGEFLVTDTIQHYSGYKSDLAVESVAQADMALGKILARMTQAGVLDQWNIAVMSDHGHSEMESCIYVNNVLTDVKYAPEGASLLVATDDTDTLDQVAEALAPYGAERYSNDCVPEALCGQVHVFVAPEKVSFEDAPDGVTDPTGIPKAISTHGLKPGWAGDDRFALFAGPDVPQGMIDVAPATQVAPTLAKLLNISDKGFPQSPLF